MKDLYDVLGVPRTADAKEVKRAYRKLTQRYHPDLNPGDAPAEERFKEVSTAYEVLGDEDKRKLYDEFGEMSLTQGFDAERARAYKQAGGGRGFRGGGPGGGGFPGGGFPGGGGGFSNFSDAQGTNFDDLLSQLFGGGRVRDADPFSGRGRRPATTTRDIEGEIEIKFIESLFGTTRPLRIETRDGTARTLDVKVPAGISDGGKLRLRKQGAGSPPGDILLTVRVTPHPRLERDGMNLSMELPITALEAYRGGPVDVPTPWGVLTIKLAPGSQNGQVLRLKGKGVKLGKKPPGDLHVTLDVRLPEAGSAELLEVLETLQGDEDPRAGLTF